MEILDLLPDLNRVVTQVKVTTKKNLFERLAETASIHLSMAIRPIFEAITLREKLGTTGMGNGVAIPHARFPNLLKVYGLFFQLENSIDFEAIDNHPVDLVFLLLAPELQSADHLKALAKVSRLLRDYGFCEKLRHTKDKNLLYSYLIGDPLRHAA